MSVASVKSKQNNYHILPLIFVETANGENWNIVSNLVTPAHLIKHGNISYSTLASYLGLLNEYANATSKIEDDYIKVYYNVFHNIQL